MFKTLTPRKGFSPDDAKAGSFGYVVAPLPKLPALAAFVIDHVQSSAYRVGRSHDRMFIGVTQA
jgi:hypothetical protein